MTGNCQQPGAGASRHLFRLHFDRASSFRFQLPEPVWFLAFRVPDPFFPYRVPTVRAAAIIPSLLYRPETLKKPRCIRLYVHAAAVQGRSLAT